MLPRALCSLLLLLVADHQVAARPTVYERLFGLSQVVLGGSHNQQQVLADSPQRVLSPNSETTGPGGPRRNPFLTLQQNQRQGPQRKATGFAAFGDSYSAGIGTFVDGKEDDCRHGNGAYPYLINADLVASRSAGSSDDDGTGDGDGNVTTAFQWLSCTGSITDDVLSGGDSSQIDTFNMTFGQPDATTDFATLSIGGNDLGFFDVINACIFRFYSFYSGTCESALALSDKQINSPEFELRLSLILMEILDKVQWEKRPGFVITVTGYTRFFNAETTACDDASLGVWWGGPKLKQSTRQRMNKLVVAVNAKLRGGIDRLNAKFRRPKAFFVDYDAAFEGHRFCEPNVTEPDYNRTETWFFLPGGPDNAPTPPANLSSSSSATAEMLLSPFSPLVDPDTCLPRAQRSGDWGELALCYMAMAKKRDPSLRPAHDRITAQNSMWYVPTYYGKTFHPRTLGHQVVRDKVYEVWDREGFLGANWPAA